MMGESSKPDDLPDMADLVREVADVFLIPSKVPELLASVQEDLPDLPAAYEEIRAAFLSNLQGLLSTLAIPFDLASKRTLDLHFQRLSSAEMVASLLVEADEGETEAELEARRDVIARNASQSAMSGFLASASGQKAVADGTCVFLFRALTHQDMMEAARELRMQGIVLAWGAFEVLARDTITTYLNSEPEAVQLLRANPVAWRLLGIGKIPFETLAEHGFDLSNKMGSLLLTRQDLSDFRSIKGLYSALFPEGDGLLRALASEDLRLLSARRHLVVHRRGVIDDQYLSTVGTEQPKGERLVVSPKDLKRHVKACVMAGREILLSVA